jgi:hypothetical protein
VSRHLGSLCAETKERLIGKALGEELHSYQLSNVFAPRNLQSASSVSFLTGPESHGRGADENHVKVIEDVGSSLRHLLVLQLVNCNQIMQFICLKLAIPGSVDPAEK